MNWKASLTGAVIVVIAGAAVGVAIGGKTKTQTRLVSGSQKTVTVTVTKTVSTPITTPTPGSTTSGGTTTPKGSGGSKAMYFSDFLNSQNTGYNSPPSQSVSLDSSPSSLVLQGKTYVNAVAFDLDPAYSSTPGTISIQLPIAGYSHFRCNTAGLTEQTNQGASYTLRIYKNHPVPGATVLYRKTFTGPSGTHSMDFNIQGATDLVFEWQYNPNSQSVSSNDTFVLADPTIS